MGEASGGNKSSWQIHCILQKTNNQYLSCLSVCFIATSFSVNSPGMRLVESSRAVCDTSNILPWCLDIVGSCSEEATRIIMVAIQSAPLSSSILYVSGCLPRSDASNQLSLSSLLGPGYCSLQGAKLPPSYTTLTPLALNTDTAFGKGRRT